MTRGGAEVRTVDLRFNSQGTSSVDATLILMSPAPLVLHFPLAQGLHAHGHRDLDALVDVPHAAYLHPPGFNRTLLALASRCHFRGARVNST